MQKIELGTENGNGFAKFGDLKESVIIRGNTNNDIQNACKIAMNRLCVENNLNPQHYFYGDTHPYSVNYRGWVYGKTGSKNSNSPTNNPWNPWPKISWRI